MPLTLFLLSSCKIQGGNYSTISRISSHLEKHGHTCVLRDVREIEMTGDVNQLVKDLQVDLLIGIHAFHSGRILKDCNVPYILILGGTDVNEFCKDEEQMAVMTLAIARASLLDIDILSVKAAMTKPSLFDFYRHLQENFGVQHNEKRYVCILVGAVRPVKNPLFLMDTFSDLHRVNKKFLFVIVGPVADESYFKQEFQPALERCEGVIYIPGLSFEDTHAAIQHSFALINSSESEGMSLAILEAMELNTPVLVHNIAGNRAIVQDGQNGLLFNTPQEFHEKLLKLVTDSAYRKQLVKCAAHYVSLCHSLKQEEMAYFHAVRQCYASTTCINAHW